MSPPSTAPPLEGVRVLELGSFIAGPFAGQLLADLGADVVKVEDPVAGDAMRRWGTLHNGRAIHWSVISRSKRSVAIDLRQQRGLELVRALALECDVVLENFAPGRLAGWGLSYEDLAAKRPGIIVTHVSGFGQTGPRAGERGFGSVAEAMGGLRHVTGSPDRPPARAAISLGDSAAALFSTIGTMAALRARDRDGIGQEVDIALYEAVFALMESLVGEYELEGVVRQRAGGRLPGAVPSDAYPTGDGRIMVIAANGDGVFRRLAEAIGHPELASDERYATHVERGRRPDDLDQIIERWTKAHSADELDGLLDAAAVPHGLVMTAEDILADEQYRAREMIQTIHDPELDADVPMANVVPRLTRTPGAIRFAGPRLGQHTHEVLVGLGLCTQAELDDLERQDVVACPLPAAEEGSHV